MNFNIDRIEAKKDIRELTLKVSAGNSDSASSRKDELVLEVGTIVKMDDDPIRTAVRDKVGFAALREMVG